MKSLQSLKNDLLSEVENSSILSSKQKKDIKGGNYYSSKEECEADCPGSWQTSPGGPGGSTFCHAESGNPEIWNCLDS